jgi:AAA family ATP:ADP antiporter
LFSWIVASGDNILFGMIQEVISADLVAITNPEDLSQAVKTATTAFYSDLYFWINLIGLLLQAFIVSRLIQFGGFSLLVLATPLISLVAYFSMAIAPVLGIIKFMKIAENSSNYSINNTARHMLWLPTTKAMLYQAKATVDTLFVRIGDGLAALIVLLGTRVWSFSLFDFLIINIVLSLIWTGFAIYLSREYRRMDRENQAGAIPLTTT